MREFAYPAMLRKEARGAYTVTFPDFPEAITSGSNQSDALAQAEDCLQEALAGRMVRKEGIPRASKCRNRQAPVGVAWYLVPKLALYVALREAGISNSAFARRLHVTEAVVRRMLDPKHATRPEKLHRALAVMGKRVVAEIRDTA